MFATSHDYKILCKHLEIGLTMKSLAGSPWINQVAELIVAEVIKLLNCYGCCNNYHMAGELEIELI